MNRPHDLVDAFSTLSSEATPCLYTFPESMLRALLASSSRPVPSPPQQQQQQQQQRVVPVLILVPASSSSGSSTSSSASWPAAAARQQQGALSRLLLSSGAGAAGTPWGPTAPPSRPHPDGEDLPVTLPSFGERTAAAKEMISAAPGGPVRGFSRSISLPAACSFNLVGKCFQPSSLPEIIRGSNPGFERKKKNSRKKICVFCKKNGESASTYESHALSFHNGKETIVSCPVLRKLRCERCGATGDHAHTRTHCPLNSKSNEIPVAVVLKQTRRKCDGSLRPSVLDSNVGQS